MTHLTETKEMENPPSNDDLRMLMSSISEVVFSLDTADTLIKIFQPFSKSGFIDLPDEFIGKKYADVLPERLAQEIKKAVASLKENPQTPVEFTYSIAEEPEKKWFGAKMSSMRNARGQICGYTVVARNITEQKSNETRQKLLEDDLIRAEQKAVMGRIAAGIAHEINNPASAISSDLGTLNHLVNQLPDTETKKRLLEIIARDAAAITRVTDIISAVKGAYRPGKWHLISIKDEIEIQLTLLRQEFKDRIEIKKDYAALPDIEVYGSEAGQIVLNLLKNAIDAIPDKGEIRIRTRDTGATISVSISDSGAGIPPHQLPHIFEPFYTTKAVGKGTGLGLSISLSNVKRHNGRLYVEKTIVGHGTTIVLELPKKKVADEKI
ncbi:MAG: ATP-binding protein [Chitinivibrionales bacterium]|nr:ATP-binding protein [Chitinivibrionales bacterium]